MYLLDTCVLLWLADDQGSLSHAAHQAIKEGAGNLFVSSISGFEIAVKSERGAFVLPLPAYEWISLALLHHGIAEVPVTCDIGCRAAALPKIHRDPCDRIIVATALKHDMTIVTRDATLGAYPGVRVCW